MLLLANKMDQPDSEGNFEALSDLYRGKYECIPISAETGQGLDRFTRRIFELLSVVRVYTKAPGKKAELEAPYVLKRGATVLDAARHVHKDFAEQLKFARLFHKIRRPRRASDRAQSRGRRRGYPGVPHLIL